MLSNCRSGTSVIAVNESGEIVGMLLGGVKTKVDYQVHFYAVVFKAGSVQIRSLSEWDGTGRFEIQLLYNLIKLINWSTNWLEFLA